MSTTKGLKFIVWMYFKRLIRECLKAIWKCLTKKRFIADYKKKKAILMIVFLFIDGFIWNGLIDDLKRIDFNDKIVYERVGDSLVTGQPVAEAHDTQDSENGEDEADLVSTSPAIEWDGVVEVSAYTAREEETDSSPTITANGETVYEGGIASNCYPFGTKIELKGLGIFTVNDRMNSRYDCGNADIFLTNYNKALDFGRQVLEFNILES